MTRITFVSLKAYPLFNPKCNETFGGSEVQVSNYAKELSKKHKVSIIVADFGQKSVEKHGGITIVKSYSLKKTPLNYLKAPLVLEKAIKRTKPEIIICRAKGPEVGLCAAYARIKKIPLIYMIAHDGDARGDFFKGILGKLFKYGIKNADHIIAQNNYQYKTYIKRFKKNNISLLDASYPLTPPPKRKENYALWVGRSDHWKRPDLLIKLAKALPEHKFVMIMPKSDEKIWTRERRKALSTQNIKFIEKVPFAKIQKYFNKARVLVSTSESEGYPNVFVQACIAGTPIVSLKANPNNALEKIGFFCKGEFKTLVKKTRLLLEDDKRWREKSRKAREHAEKKHDIKKNILKLDKIIEKTIIEKEKNNK
ncbi:glycosyltransferase [Candidatus Woesearchaeota archaeon]|nr:MAG: glycosyltransferase [Candidatus Woesearchaeota archaeon]